MDIWLILLLGGLIFFGLLVVLLVLYTNGNMGQMPLWTGLSYSREYKLGLKGYEKVQIVEETPEGQTKQTITEATPEGQTKKKTITYELQPGKTLWDWLQLLLVPVVLAIVAFSFNAGQASMNLQLEEQSKQEQVINDYLNQMSTILLQYKLHDSQPGDPIRALAQASTLTALGRLDSEHKNIIILFLYRADILKYHFYNHNETECGNPQVLKKQFHDENPIITLSQGHIEGVTINDLGLSCIDLHNMYLRGSNFSASNLDRANLGLSFAMNADFSHTSMMSADLFFVELSGANLQGAILQFANMKGICLSRARLDGADLQHANLTVYRRSINGALLFCGQYYKTTSIFANLSYANLSQANLSYANLSQANLTGANLSQANLTGANLSQANLTHANLAQANLTGATISSEQLAEAVSLTDAIMPNGSKHP